MPLRFAITPETSRAFEADQWAQPHMQALADDWEQQATDRLNLGPAPAPPPAPVASDSLTNPLGMGNASLDAGATPPAPAAPPPDAAPEQSPPFPVPAPVPAPPTSSVDTTPAPSLPAPSAPPTLDFGSAAPETPAQRPLPASPASVPPAPTPTPTFTETTAGLSGGGSAAAPSLTDRGQAILSTGANIASWLGEQGQKALQAVLVTEGGLNNARGDKGMSAGPLQFYEGGQLANFARERGLTLDAAKSYVEQHPEDAIAWAVGTPDKPGYLGGAILNGISKGLTGADLATWAQRTGQVSVSPERAGSNFNALFGGGGKPFAVTPGNTVASQPIDTSLNLSQFGDKTLTADEAYAACGPAAAARLAAEYGNAIPLSAALAAAKQTGWTSSGGMNGIANEKKLFDALNLPAELDTSPTWDKIINGATNGQLVTISTPGHYFQANATRQRSDGQTELYVGQSGLDLKGGKAWMTPGEIEQRMGALNGALFSDPGRAVLAGDWYQAQAQNHGFQPTPPDQVVSEIGQAAKKAGIAAPTPDETVTNPFGEALRQVGAVKDQLGGAISQVAGGVYDALPQGSILKGGLNVSNAAVPATDASTSTMPTGGTLFRQAEQQKNEAIAANNPLRDMPLVGGATTMAAQVATDPLTYIAGGPLDSAAKEMIARTGLRETPDLVQAVARNLVQGGGFGAITGLEDPNATPQSVAGSTVAGAALGGGLGLAGEGASRVLGSPAVQDALRARQRGQGINPLNPPPVPPPSSAPTQSANPLIQRTGQMLAAKPPAPPTDSLATRLVRAWTNRNVSLDQFQEESARLAGVDPTQLPASADASALVRLSSDPAAEIRIQQELKPAVQAVGDDTPWLSTYLMHANNVDVAKQLGNPNRKFPGGFTAADSAQVLADLPAELGPQRYAQVQQAASQVGDFVKGIRQRMVDSGLIDQATATKWEQQYPNWVPTRILDYLDEAGRAGGAPKKLSLGDAGVKSYTLEGTQKFAEDPLGSLIGLARSVETRARKNDTVNALVNLDQMRPQGSQLLQQTNRPATALETVVQRVNNGQVERYIAPPELAAVINGPVIQQAPGYVRAFTNFQRAVTTVLSPAFALVRNPSLDVPEYMTRELARAGGNPLALPQIVGDLMKGYAEAFKGLPQNEFRGATARFMQAGGGDSGMVTRTVANRAAAVQALSRGSALEIRNLSDVQRILKDVVTLRPVAELAQRTEYGPRTASFIRAERAGATGPRAALAGRTVTMDFNEGGTLAKTINSFVPFFNAGFQGSAQLPRMIRENPAGTASSLALTVGLPATAATLWNRADPQRSADYEDVPQYLKDQGIVLMLPGEVPTDAKGNRKPQFLWMNMRGFAPIASLSRDITERSLQAAGNGNAKPEDAQNLLNSIFWSSLPTRANTIGDVPGSIASANFPLPGGGTALQLALNKDIFRRADIVSNYADQNAPQGAKELAGTITSVAQMFNPNAEIHPSQVNFAIRELLGGVGATALGARELVPGGQRVDTTPQGAPVVGGALRALGVRGDTGATLTTALGQTVPPNIERVLRDAGISAPTIPPTISIPSPITNSNSPPIELRQNERARYQQLFSQRLAERLAPITNSPTWAQRPIDSRNKLLEGQIKAARDYAEAEIYRAMPSAERQTRMAAGREAAKLKPKP